MTIFDHDYKNFPELTNTQLEILRFTSPHVQYTEDFWATVVKVHDGDTVTLSTEDRDFDFPLRLLGIDAPELNEGGKETGDWLREWILDKEVLILIDKRNRVGKYGRLLGDIMADGMSVAEILLIEGRAAPFEARNEGKIPGFDKIMAEAGV